MISLRLELAPTGKARPRERGRLPTAYRRWKINAAGQLRALLIMAKWPRAMDARRDAVRVTVTGYTARPKSAPAWMTTAERAAFRRGWTPPRLATPDADNMAGAVLDALTRLGAMLARRHPSGSRRRVEHLGRRWREPPPDGDP